MNLSFTSVDRELVELAIELVAAGEQPEIALSRASARLIEAGRKGVRFEHVLALESGVTRGARQGADARVASLRQLLAAMGPA